MRLIKMEDNATVRIKDTTNHNVQFHYLRESDGEVRDQTATVSNESTNMIQPQYLNIQRVPDIVNASKNFTTLLNGNELLVDANGDLITGTALDRYITQDYDGDLIQDDLTDEDRRLAAALVAVQLVNQQKQQTVSHILPLLSSSTLQVGGSKLVAADSAVVAMPPLSGPNKVATAQHSPAHGDDMSSASQNLPEYLPAQAGGQLIDEAPLQPLPPLKKVLSRNKLLRPQTSIPIPSPQVQVPLESLGIHTEIDSMDVEISETVDIKPEMEFILPDDGKDTYDSEEESEILDSDYDVTEDSRRHSLPHKKRIARRLRQPKKQTAGARQMRGASSKRTFQPGGSQVASNKFSCELCFQSFNNQWKFFEHLKLHYELDGASSSPRKSNIQSEKEGVPTDLPPIKTSVSHPSRLRAASSTPSPTPSPSTGIRYLAPRPILSPRPTPPRLNPMPRLVTQKIICTPKPAATTKEPNLSPRATRVKSTPQVQNRWTAVNEELQEIINSAPLLQQQLQGTVVPTLWECQPCKRVFRRQKAFESHMSVAHLKDETVEEFSEPEDMMEGIKVQVVSDEEKEVSPGTKEVAIQKEWYDEEDLQATEEDLKVAEVMKSETDTKINTDCLHTEIDLRVLNQVDERGLPVMTENEPEEERNCVLCREIFATKKDMKQHIRQMHGDIMNAITKNVRRNPDGTARKGSLACKECGRRFHHRNSLLYHVRSHGGERAHQCEVCGKSFFARSALKVHMRQHSGAKPFKCDFCGRFFRQWGDLKYHVISIHSDQRNYQCEFCGKDFARKYSLTVHSRIHTGERNYKCEFCSKSFRAATYLQNHRRVHTGEKPHMCEICGKPFRVRSDMKRHLTTHRDPTTGCFPKSKSDSNVSSPSTDSKFMTDVTEVPDHVSDQQLSISEISKVEELEVSTVEGILSEESVRASSRIQDDLSNTYIPREGLDPQREQNTLYFWQVFPT